MKEWCLEHPYLTFFTIMGFLSAFNNIVNKVVDLFVKPVPTTVNMNMSLDPSKNVIENVVNSDESFH